MEETKTVMLTKPVQLGDPSKGGMLYAEVNLREPLVGEIEKASRADTSTGVSISLVALVSGLPRAAVERMSARDFQECADFLNGFQSQRQTGETDSPS